METLADLSWRIWPAVAMVIVGAVMAIVGGRREIAGLRAPFSDRDKTLTMMAGFRMAIVGAALALFGAAWLGQVTWLMWLAAIIGACELFESSMMISGIRMGQQAADAQRARRATRRPTA